MKRVLVACEESQAVTIELRKLGIEAFSCDIEPCSGGHPEWHLQQDVTPLLNEDWDMIIAFPPCTYLTVSGSAWYYHPEDKHLPLEERRPHPKYPNRRKDQQEGIDFFMLFANNKCNNIAIENPIGVMSTKFRKPDQIIQPWQFGHGETKATCLWLKGLPKLKPTDIVEGREQRLHYLPPSKDRAKLRSKTYDGIAKAMAIQWSKYLLGD
jgi:hypothetical protein